ncbi:Dabb family protein [Tateyamaria sp.]|uniref:Dabb family protein n=1 Tax=Tateyamaria sp. TaxID=1929288 RepID=UPI00329C25BE
MIRHCVMLRLLPDADRDVLDPIMRELAALVEKLDGCGNFCAGPNLDFENKSPDVPFGFTFDAADAASLSRYAAHPEHVALGARLVALCQGGGAGIVVYDLECAL